jgi:hypothetical protein
MDSLQDRSRHRDPTLSPDSSNLTLAQLRDDAELLRHAQRVQADPLFVDSPLDQQIGSALTVSWSGDAEQFVPVGAVYSVAAHDFVSLRKAEEVLELLRYVHRI